MISLENRLPFDGEVYYLKNIFSKIKSEEYFNALLKEIKWENDQVMMFGKTIVTKREVAWYGEKPFNYKYSKINKKANLYSDLLYEIQHYIEKISKDTFNCCLLNLYHDGSEGMGWHADNEKELSPNGTIASISFGVDRLFQFKHKTSNKLIEIVLEDSSLLIMKGVTQKYWLHSLPIRKKIGLPRINLTFRTIID